MKFFPYPESGLVGPWRVPKAFGSGCKSIRSSLRDGEKIILMTLKIRL